MLVATFSFDLKPARSKQRLGPPSSPRVPRLARLLALARELEGLIGNGTICDYACLARLGHVSRARISQITSLVKSVPDIQEEILFSPSMRSGRDPIALRHLQPITLIPSWAKQRRLWRHLKRKFLSASEPIRPRRDHAAPPSTDRSGAMLDQTTPPLASTQATVGAELRQRSGSDSPLTSKEKAQEFRIAKRPPRIGLENSPRKLTAANPEISRVFSQKTRAVNFRGENFESCPGTSSTWCETPGDNDVLQDAEGRASP